MVRFTKNGAKQSPGLWGYAFVSEDPNTRRQNSAGPESDWAAVHGARNSGSLVGGKQDEFTSLLALVSKVDLSRQMISTEFLLKWHDILGWIEWKVLVTLSMQIQLAVSHSWGCHSACGWGWCGAAESHVTDSLSWNASLRRSPQLF